MNNFLGTHFFHAIKKFEVVSIENLSSEINILYMPISSIGLLGFFLKIKKNCQAAYVCHQFLFQLKISNRNETLRRIVPQRQQTPRAFLTGHSIHILL